MDELTKVKTCPTCKIVKDESLFSKNKRQSDGLQYECKSCNAEYYAKPENRAKAAERNRTLYAKPENKAKREERRAKPENKAKRTEYQRKLYAKPENKAKRTEKRRKASPEKRLLQSTKHNARLHNREHTLVLADIVIPKYCPVLGIKLNTNIGNRRLRDDSPSVDRLDSTKGYTKENIKVISWRANNCKGYFTANEHLLVAKFTLQCEGTLA